MIRPTTSQLPLAVVTGASGALGAAIHTQLLDQGWYVVATYRTHQPSNPADTTRTTWVHFDTGERNGGDQLRQAVDLYTGELRAVFACIGAPSSKTVVSDTTTEEFEHVFHANVMSLVHTWHALAPRARSDGSSLLALGSDAGRAARSGNGPYTAAKAALEALVVTLAKEELTFGVRANLLAPSLIDSPLAQHVMRLKGVTDPDSYYQQLPWGRPLSLSEVAQVCIDINTAAHWSYATGQVYPLQVAAA
ncbi:SDR family NAD(P)-dependent oxidoreductase [Streptacidiphilus fuscans]|uniref:SDR family oxidoreductase n=1 Tax=Streptacidiphilus fuscans TaxID=2789292 RepID=A0A931BE99_9ACTN|nr:SDR family oxidoreductase [Streptacidiphilus fuscans]MBF9071865.1 SDR family oxidoreductase [Streptacidiphilus fuscans]